MPTKQTNPERPNRTAGFWAGVICLPVFLLAVYPSSGRAAEAQDWVGLIKGMVSAPASAQTLQQAITFLNHYPRSSRRGVAEYMIAESYFLGGKYENALAYYRHLVTANDPANQYLLDSVLFRMGECYFNSGQTDKADQTWEEMLRRYPDTHLRAEVEANRCQLLLKQGKFSEAENRYRSLLSRYPYYRERKSVLIGLSQIDWSYQKYDAILKRLGGLNTPEAYYLRGRALFALERYQEAASYFDKIVKNYLRHPYALNAAYLKAESFFQLNNDVAAEEAYQEFLKLFPATQLSSFARFKLAAVQLRKKKYTDALVNVQRLRAGQNPLITDFLLKYLMAEILVGLERFPQASELYREIVFNAPPEQVLETSLLKYAWVLYKGRQYPSAIKAAFRYLQDFGGNPRAISAQFIIANSHYAMGNYPEAIRTYREILLLYKYSVLLEIAVVQMQITLMQTHQLNQIISQTATVIQAMEENIKPENRNYRSMALYFLAEAYYREQKPQEAIALYEAIATKYWDTPAMAYAKESLVWALFAQEKYADALQEAEKVIKDRRLDPTIRTSMLLVKAHSLFNQKLYKEALGSYQEWLGKNPRANQVMQVQYLMGLAYYRLKFYKNALEIWEKVINSPNRDEYSREALIKVADALFRGADFPRAVERYRLFIQRYPRDNMVPMAHLRIAQANYNQGQDGNAIAEYQFFIQNFPQHESLTTAQDGIENTVFRQVKKNPSIENLKAFLLRYPKSKFANQAQYQIAELYYKQKNFGLAIPEFNKLILNYPGSEAIANSMFYLGDSFDQLQKYADAVSAYGLFTETYPKSDLMPEVLTRLAADHFILKNFDEAINLYRRIIDQFPVKPYVEDALYNIAVVYEKTKRASEAMAMYMDFAERYPSNPRTADARIQVGIYYQDQQLWDLALDSFQKAMTGKNVGRPELYFRIGDCYENTGRIDQAKQFYGRVVSLTPKTDLYRITAMSQLAAMYERDQAWNKAVALYRDIAQNAPKPEWRDEAVKRIQQISNP